MLCWNKRLHASLVDIFYYTNWNISYIWKTLYKDLWNKCYCVHLKSETIEMFFDIFDIWNHQVPRFREQLAYDDEDLIGMHNV